MVSVEVHHVVPFEVDRSRERDETNLVTMDEGLGGFECHLRIGHGGSFHYYNPYVRTDAAELRAHPERRGTIEARARKNRCPIPRRHA
jgi:hypothetical protein